MIGLQIEKKSLTYLRDIEDHGHKMARGHRLAFYNIGKENTRYTREIIKKGPKTGRLYRIPGRKRRHRASAPGEPPANLRGRLRAGVDFEVKGTDQMVFGDRVPYGYYLERGSKKMAKRPHLIRAINKNEAYAEQELGLRPIKELYS